MRTARPSSDRSFSCSQDKGSSRNKCDLCSELRPSLASERPRRSGAALRGTAAYGERIWAECRLRRPPRPEGDREQASSGRLPTPVAAAAERALGDAEAIRERSREVARRGLSIFTEWLAEFDGASWAPPSGGVTAFVAFDGLPDTSLLCDWLLDERDTAVVPGHFCGDCSRVRLAFGVDPAVLEPALHHLAEGVERFRTAS